MAEAKTKLTEESVTDFLNRIADEPRRNDCFAVLELLEAATGVEAKMWGDAIVGFGSYKVRYADGREAEWPIIGFSPRKNDLTVYMSRDFPSSAALLTKLGKHKTGKVCLYIKKLADVDLAVLKELIAKSLESTAYKRIS